MGAVYKARAEHLQITVAVKEATVTNQSLLRAFEKEPSWLARGAFVVFMAYGALLVSFCLLVGWLVVLAQ